MEKEINERLILQMEMLKSYEIHGGDPANYKETLTNLRDAIVLSISKEKDSIVVGRLVSALVTVIDAINLIDGIRMGQDSDELIREGKFIQMLASNLLGKNAMIIFDVTIKQN